MSTHRIARLGMDEALPPYRRVRMSPAGSFVLACVSGEGSILLDGRWQRVKPGMVCLAPPRVLNAFEAKGREKWCFAWVRYDEPSFVTPVVGASSPVIPAAHAEDISRIVCGLRSEWEGEKEPRMLHHWLELLHGTIRRIAQPWRSKEPRVAKLWAEVVQDLQRDWTLAELAHRCHCSPEHLRRQSAFAATWDDTAAAFAKIREALRPGGRIVLLTSEYDLIKEEVRKLPRLTITTGYSVAVLGVWGRIYIIDVT